MGREDPWCRNPDRSGGSLMSAIGIRGGDAASESRVRLIGRDRELRELAAHEGVVGLAGEPGIGKTRLLEELAARWAPRTVLRGAATEFETDVPFAPFAELFDEPSGMLPAERYRYHREVGARLERMADGRPVLLIVDDAHWADPASIELIAHLARRPIRTPLLVVAAFRPAQASERLAAGAGRPAARDARPPVARRGRRAAARRAVASRRDDVYERAGGNPLFLDALSRSGGVPDTVLDALSRRARGAPAGRARAGPRRRGRGGAVRAGARHRRGRARRAGGARRARRAAGRGAGARVRAARVPLPSSDRAPGHLRPHRRGLADRRPRPRGRGARASGRRAGAARAPPRAVRAAG